MLVGGRQNRERLAHGLAQGDRILASATAMFGNAEHRLLGLRQHLLAVAAGGLKRAVDNLRAGIDQLPHHRLFAPDGGVRRNIRRRWRAAGKLDQVCRSEERRVGKECVSTVRSWWWRDHIKNKKQP